MMLMSFLEKHFNKQKTPSPSKKAFRGGHSKRSDECTTPGLKPRGRGEEEAGEGMTEAGAKMSPSASSPDDDYETELAHKLQRDTQLGWMFAFVGGSVAASWALGASGVSVAWLLLLLALLAAVWRASLRRLVDGAIRYETLRVARRRALSADETAEWFNFLVNRWWVFSSPSLYALIRENLEPLLNEVKPSIVERLELRHFTLGDQTPHVRSVRAFDVTGGGVRRPLSAASLARPPAGLALRLNHQVVLEADVRLDCDDFRMVLRTRFGKGVGMDMDLAMEKLNISGRVNITFSLSMDAPFPHVTHLTLSFLERPEVWFSVRILKAVQMMEVPLLKTWIHSVVMEALVTSLVDPGKLDINLAPSDRPSAGRGPGDTLAQGVLTVTLSLPAANSTSNNSATPANRDRTQSGVGLEGDARWLVICLGEQRIVTPHLGPRWQHTGSFLLSSLHTDQLLVKLKTKRLVSAITLAQFELPLASYNLDSNKVVETVLHKKLTKVSSGAIPNIAMRFEYTPLSTVNLDGTAETPTTPSEEHGVAGVLLVCIHGADGLALTADQKDCNPYCMVFNNRKKVKTTHYLKATGSPQWESKTQFLVSDYSQAALSFVVCSWGRDKIGDTDLLGITTLSLTPEDSHVIRRKLPLSCNSPPTARSSSPAAAGSITVSIVFNPVNSVAQSMSTHNKTSTSAHSPGGSDEDDSSVSSGRSKRSGSNWMQQAKQLLSCKDPDNNADISSLLANGLGLMEVSLIRARDLVAKDLNGFSDPYCELKINGECKYKSNIKKKTLNPVWEESAIMGLPRSGEHLELVIWDHDVFGMKDFLGNISLKIDEIRHLSSLDVAQWRQLQGVKTGSVEIRIKVISEVTETNATSTNHQVATPKSQERRSEADRAKLRLAFDGPPVPPVRTVTASNYKSSVPVIKHPSETDLHDAPVTNGHRHSTPSTAGPPTPATSPSVPSMLVSSLHGSLTPSPEPQFKKNQNEYSSFRIMKNKMKRGLTLRRFRSEVNVPGAEGHTSGKSGSSAVALSIEPRGAGEADATELLHGEGPLLSHAVSQPNILCQPSPRPTAARRPTDLKVRHNTRPERFVGIEGKIIQAQGLHVAHIAQLYCRVKLHSGNSPDKPHRGSSGKTLAKSRLIPAVPNPRFDLGFEVDNPEGVPRQATLLFEIRATGKELVASRRITMQDLLSDSSPETNEVRTWLALSTGASIEVEVAYGREPKKGSRRLFRSWSVHRIGKI